MKKTRYILGLLLALMCFAYQSQAQPCYPDKVVTAAFATGGESPYIDKVLWLTWGSTNQETHPYGNHDQPLSVGAKSYASIHLGGDSYLCVEVEIVAIAGGAVNSYAPGNWEGDSMDILYNIGGSGKNNQMVAGVINRNNNNTSTLTFRAKANISGEPIRISGLAIADAEALNTSGEYIRATAHGTWNIVDIRKNVANNRQYRIAKRNAGSNQQRIEFQRGTDNFTGAVAFLDFNEDAYDTEQNEFAVEFTAELYGGGLTALAIGLLTPNADLGDAPESYGAPIHLLHNLKITDDGIPVGTSGYTNINTSAYVPGALEPFDGRYLGTTAPDADNAPMHSKNADGDDNSGDAGPNEEDAWPEKYRRFSYKAHYLPGNEIQAEIAYHNGEVGDKISGWIDFDLNGTFDPGERQTAEITQAGSGTVTLTWVVPPTRKVYSTYVRLRYFDANEDATIPDHAVNYGEVEDHRMYILGPTITNPMLPNKVVD